MRDKTDGEREIKEQQEIELVEKEHKFSLAKFAVGWAKIITSMSFLAWAVYTVLFVIFLRQVFSIADKDKVIELMKSASVIILAGGWVATTFVLAINLQKGIGTMVSNAKISAEIKAGVSKNIDLKGTADAAQIASAVKTKG